MCSETLFFVCLHVTNVHEQTVQFEKGLGQMSSYLWRSLCYLTLDNMFCSRLTSYFSDVINFQIQGNLCLMQHRDTNIPFSVFHNRDGVPLFHSLILLSMMWLTHKLKMSFQLIVSLKCWGLSTCIWQLPVGFCVHEHKSQRFLALLPKTPLSFRKQYIVRLFPVPSSWSSVILLKFSLVLLPPFEIFFCSAV